LRREEVAESYRRLAAAGATRFEGFTATQLHAVPVLALLDAQGREVDALREGEEGQVVLEATPFYAEAGGQMADAGFLNGPNGRADVQDVQRPVEGLSVHHVRVQSGHLAGGDPS
jgi:alanyl-tRNA synthetase